MRNLKTYKLFLENYSEVKNKIDEILDKISSHGVESLTPGEINLLDSQREGGEASEKAYSKLVSKDINKEFESDNGKFIFTLNHIETEDSNSDDGKLFTIYFNGIMELPDIVTGDGRVIGGNVEGSILLNEHGLSQKNFQKEGYTDYDFVEGLEHEYDNFIHELTIKLSDDFYSL